MLSIIFMQRHSFFIFAFIHFLSSFLRLPKVLFIFRRLSLLQFLALCFRSSVLCICEWSLETVQSFALLFFFFFFFFFVCLWPHNGACGQLRLRFIRVYACWIWATCYTLNEIRHSDTDTSDSSSTWSLWPTPSLTLPPLIHYLCYVSQRNCKISFYGLFFCCCCAPNKTEWHVVALAHQLSLQLVNVNGNAKEIGMSSVHCKQKYIS